MSLVQGLRALSQPNASRFRNRDQKLNARLLGRNLCSLGTSESRKRYERGLAKVVVKPANFKKGKVLSAQPSVIENNTPTSRSGKRGWVTT
jgi:hypothetical protein